jgi:ParB family chromosome partitioning protein
MNKTPPIIFVPASKLSIAPTNVRKRSDPEADAELKASIAAKGIIQNLIGIPVARKKGEYHITAGGRRLTQIHALIEDGVLGPDYPVAVMVLADKNDATEVSLIENFIRLNMSPAEECRAFQAIIDGEKKTPADVAKHFGLTERFVLGRLRLAGLADSIFEALAAGEITLDVAKAYASISDTVRQAAVFEEMGGGYYSTNLSEIRRRLVSGFYRGSDPKALLVGRDAYIAAGGRIDSDLFSDAANENWIDSEIIDRLAAERMEAAAQAVRAQDGFGEVRIICETRIPYMETMALDELEGEPAELTPEEEERQRAIEVELEAIAEEADEDGYSDEEISRIKALEAEHKALNEKPPFITAEQKEKALAYLVIGSDGQPRLYERLFIVPEPELEVEEAEAEAGTDEITSEEAEQELVEDGPSIAPISQKLAEELAIMKTEILRLHVASDPHFALDLGTFFMVDVALGRSYGHPSELRAAAPFSRVPGFESDTQASEAWTELDAGLDRSWTEAVNIVERYDAFCGLDEGARAAWLGWAIARTLHAVPVGGTGADLIDHLGRKLEIEEHVWWRPTARRYFDRVSKGRILAHFGEVGGLELSNRYAASKKHDLAASAEKLFAGQLIVEAEVKDRALSWLPDEMRFGRAEHPDCERSKQDGDGLPVEPADGAVSEDAGDGFPEAA